MRWIVLIAIGVVMALGGESKATESLEGINGQNKTTRVIIGRLENVHILDIGISKKARIDTGAKTTSIDARDVEVFERNGVNWVRFSFEGEYLERPVVRTVRIKRHGGKSIRRQVVELEFKLGEITRKVEVTLANRKKYTYAILIGRNFLKKRFIVDVGEVFLGRLNKVVVLP